MYLLSYVVIELLDQLQFPVLIPKQLGTCAQPGFL